MKLKKIDISSRDFALIKPQLKFDWYTYYLVKYDGRWKAGCISFASGRGAGDPNDPCHYDFDLGSHSAQLGHGLKNTISDFYEEIYEIIDPSLKRKHAKELLK